MKQTRPSTKNVHHQHKGQEEEGKGRNNCSVGESNKFDDGANEGTFPSTQPVKHDQSVNAEAKIANPNSSSTTTTTTKSGGSSPLRRSKRDTNVGHNSVAGLSLVCLRLFSFHNPKLEFVFVSLLGPSLWDRFV